MVAELAGSILHIVQPTTYSTLGVYDSRLPLATVDTCTWGKLITWYLGSFTVLGPVCPCTIEPFLPSFLSQRHSHEKRYQTSSGKLTGFMYKAKYSS